MGLGYKWYLVIWL